MNIEILSVDERVTQLISDRLSLDLSLIKPESYLTTELGSSSMQIFELISDIEDEFNCTISQHLIHEVLTVGDLIQSIKTQLELNAIKGTANE